MTQPVQTPEQHVYLTKLLGYNYIIQYKVGHNNVVEDALSCLHEPGYTEEVFLIVSMPHPMFPEDLEKELYASVEFQNFMHRVHSEPSQYQAFKIRDGLLLYQGHIRVNKDNPFIPLLLKEYHKSPLGGHMGLAKTLCRLR